MRYLPQRMPDGCGHDGRIKNEKKRNRMYFVHGVRQALPEGRTVNVSEGRAVYD